MQDKDNLDLLLDSALATYADPGPESGLEQRVLSALAAERESVQIRTAAPRRWLPWAIAIPLAASLLLWIGIAQFRHPPLQQATQIRAASPSPGSQPDSSRALKDDHSSRALKGHDFSRAANATNSPRALAPEGRLFTAQFENHAPVPKLAVFPTPQPLTPQERALATVAAQAPAPLREALVAAQELDNPPINIAAIHIPPIEESTQTQP